MDVFETEEAKLKAECGEVVIVVLKNFSQQIASFFSQSTISNIERESSALFGSDEFNSFSRVTSFACDTSMNQARLSLITTQNSLGGNWITVELVLCQIAPLDVTWATFQLSADSCAHFLRHVILG
jgi:hypothetical protein